MSCIAFCMETSASRELNWGRDILICTRNFGFGCNLVGEEEERVQTRVSRLGGCLAWGWATLRNSKNKKADSVNMLNCVCLYLRPRISICVKTLLWVGHSYLVLWEFLSGALRSNGAAEECSFWLTPDSACSSDQIDLTLPHTEIIVHIFTWLEALRFCTLTIHSSAASRHGRYTKQHSKRSRTARERRRNYTQC